MCFLLNLVGFLINFLQNFFLYFEMAFREVDFTNIQSTFNILESPETVKNLVVIVLIAFIICLLLLVSCLFFFHAYLTIT
jgi:hypothetical protein